MDDDDDVAYEWTEKGLFLAIEIHQKVLDNWTLEQVASFYDMDVMMVRIILVAFYHAMDQSDVDLGVYVPNTIEGLE